MLGLNDAAPTRDLFGRNEVLVVARDAAHDAWKKANDGWISEDGSPTRLHQPTAGAVLRATQPAWLNDRPVRDGLLRWLGSKDYNDVVGAMEALRGVSLVESERAAATEVTVRWITNRRTERFSGLRLIGVITFLEIAGLLGSVEDSLVELAADGSTASVVAASALASRLPRAEARELSASVATFAVANNQLVYAPTAVARLVALAPDAWADAVAEYLQGPQSPFGSAATLVLEHLPAAARHRALREVAPAMAPELPWVMDDGADMMRIVRPADALARLRFDAGLPMRSGAATERA
jgi:hypothetical protein